MIKTPLNIPQKPFDFNRLSQTLFLCLDNLAELCKTITAIDYINIIIATQSPNKLLFCHINTLTQQKETLSKTLSTSIDELLFEISHQAGYYNHATYQTFFADLISPQIATKIHSCYHIPLYKDQHCHVAIQFARHHNERFNNNETEQLTQLAKLMDKIILNQLEIEQLQQEKDFLAQEHLRDHILVDITNIAISTNHINDMIMAIAKEVIQFFDIDYIGILLRKNNNPPSKTLYSTYRFPQQQFTEKLNQMSALLVQQLLSYTQAQLTDLDTLSAQFPEQPLIDKMLDSGLQSLYTIPLNFVNNPSGILVLAHRDSAVFTPENTALFQQIANRLVIAIDNIQNYQKIANLNTSLTNENFYLAEEIKQLDPFKEIVGISPAIQKIFEQVDIVARSNSSVLLLGETGTGKELFANAIHQRSQRHNKRMIKINCSAVPANLLESELFGHERGAFTGANSQRIGRFELAHNSTLLLDEIGDIPLELQSKLLRVLQEREIERLGSHKTIPVDVRIISATNCNLEQMISDKAFRADLYYRLNVFPIVLPPLRERPTDIPLLAQFFIQKFAKQMKRDIDSISAQTLKELTSYHWPGNVRELANIIERAVIINKSHTLNIDLQSSLLTELPNNKVEEIKPSKINDSVDDFVTDSERKQKEKILQILKETNGIIAGPKGAAIRLGLKRTTLLSRMQRLGISAKDIIQDE